MKPYKLSFSVKSVILVIPMTSTGASNMIPRVLVLDGGFSTQLASQVDMISDGDPLWSARFLQTHPEAVYKAHLDFLRAGADVISTNTYQASVGGFVKHLGVTPEEGIGIIRRAVDLAKRARDTYVEECRQSGTQARAVLVAGSVGPYGAHLNDGSEYDGTYADKTSVETMREWHTPRIKTLIESGVDLLAIETIPCQKEAEVLVEMIKEYPTVKAWLSFSCADEETLAHGENFVKAARKCYDSNPEQLIAIGVNCCSPNIVGKLFEAVNDDRKSAPIPLITYPNSGEKYSPKSGWIEGDKCPGLDTFVHQWLDEGVRYVGGCCRTTAADITRVRTQVCSWLELKNQKH